MKVAFGSRGRTNYDYNRYFKNPNPFNVPLVNGVYDLSNVDLGVFPNIYDFEIILKDTECEELGLHVKFYSHSLGILADFPWWDNVDEELTEYTLNDIPLGSLSTPFEEFEEGWQIVISEKYSQVYILSGSSPFCTDFYSWFTVSKDIYLSEWEKVIKYLKH